ncbi:MAG: hypothetical protein CM1200mP29_13840 [Verrucomicrobiota bacterium]|nr:MAG: hypothetical protein CM1200mP29_13840 [Verrucomicrobiota bacterium]
MGLGAAEREMVLALKTGKREYVGQRIKRISGTDVHMELLNGKEQKISFLRNWTVDLRENRNPAKRRLAIPSLL